MVVFTESALQWWSPLGKSQKIGQLPQAKPILVALKVKFSDH